MTDLLTAEQIADLSRQTIYPSDRDTIEQALFLHARASVKRIGELEASLQNEKAIYEVMCMERDFADELAWDLYLKLQDAETALAVALAGAD